MSYEDGFKLTDEAAMAMHAVDKEALMCRIIQVYGQQLFIDGFFNADPPAGNLLVQVKRGRAHPVPARRQQCPPCRRLRVVLTTAQVAAPP